MPLVKARVGKVIFECQPALIELLQGTAGADEVIAAGTPAGAFDVQLPLLSLPVVLQTTLATIPGGVPYIHADPGLVAFWKNELASLPGLKIGIAWQGNPRVLCDKLRSVPLAYFEPLARLPGVSLVSLQKQPGSEQFRTTAGDWPLLDLGERLKTFSDTAAVMTNLDLIITSDTCIPHLAGALGRPVWTVLQLAPDWRWLLDRDDSPWYPSMRLYRQRSQGDWREVFTRVAKDVRLKANPPD